MATYFVSRHSGAIAWAKRQNIEAQYIEHLDVEILRVGDVVMGTLSVPGAEAACRKGARYMHLSMEVPPHMRGQELSAEMMEKLGAKLKAYHVEEQD